MLVHLYDVDVRELRAQVGRPHVLLDTGSAGGVADADDIVVLLNRHFGDADELDRVQDAPVDLHEELVHVHVEHDASHGRGRVVPLLLLEAFHGASFIRESAKIAASHDVSCRVMSGPIDEFVNE